MWAKAETWIEKIQSLLRTPQPSDSEYPNDRLPSEQVIAQFPLKGYRGPPIHISANKYFDAKQSDVFIYEHGLEMTRTGRVPKYLVDADVVTLEALVESSDAVLVLPTK
jgi:hypothetical protein